MNSKLSDIIKSIIKNPNSIAVSQYVLCNPRRLFRKINKNIFRQNAFLSKKTQRRKFFRSLSYFIFKRVSFIIFFEITKRLPHFEADQLVFHQNWECSIALQSYDNPKVVEQIEVCFRSYRISLLEQPVFKTKKYSWYGILHN